jgi:hypothetical protein
MKTKQIKILAIIAAVIVLLLASWCIYTQISEHYAQDDPKLKDLKHKFEDFFSKERYWEAPLDELNKRNIMNEISLYRGDKSYTINKEKVYLCLKDTNGSYYNDNMLIYVLAHEISHVICDEIGHTEKFHQIFEALLVKLTEEGIYNPSIPVQQNYCKEGDPEM